MFLGTGRLLASIILFFIATSAPAQDAHIPIDTTDTLTMPESPEGFVFYTMINGTSVRWMVDTGADIVTLNRTTADLLGIKVPDDKYSSEVHLGGEIIPSTRVRVGVLDLGPLKGRDVLADLLKHDSKLDYNLLGMSFLRQFRWYYEKGELRLFK